MGAKYVFDLTKFEWEKYLADEPKYRAGQIYDALHKGIAFDKINVPKELKEKIKAEFKTELPEIVKEQKSKDGTTKFLLRLYDGEMIECVLLKQDYGNTVCVSTQVGCKMACAFCASGADGFVRNLSAGEMLAQVVIARSACTTKQSNDEKVTNIVLMGSGEPFDNFDEVTKFLRLTDVGARHISLSTAGIVPKIKEFADLGLQVNLCISLHAPTDEIRQRIMPVAKKWHIKELIDAAKYFFDKTRRRVIFEYSLIDGINCEPEHAVALAKLIKGFPSHVNLILLNHIPRQSDDCHPFILKGNGGEYRPPCREVAKQFMDTLIKAGASCTMRKSKGEDIMAACGQLRLKSRQFE
jgi:23S rRNA (adenine2503-C2)-methyltransferase